MRSTSVRAAGPTGRWVSLIQSCFVAFYDGAVCLLFAFMVPAVSRGLAWSHVTCVRPSSARPVTMPGSPGNIGDSSRSLPADGGVRIDSVEKRQPLRMSRIPARNLRGTPACDELLTTLRNEAVPTVNTSVTGREGVPAGWGGVITVDLPNESRPEINYDCSPV